MWWWTPAISGTQEVKQEDYKFKVIFAYTEISQLAHNPWDCLKNPTNSNNTKISKKCTASPFPGKGHQLHIPSLRNPVACPFWAPTLSKIFVFSLQLLNSNICFDYRIIFSWCSSLHMVTHRKTDYIYNNFLPPFEVLLFSTLIYLFSSGPTTQLSSQQ